MTLLRPACTAGAAALLLLGGCGRPPATMDAAASPAASAAFVDTLVAADGDREPVIHKRGGGAFGTGIRPTGSTANGITP